MGRQLPDAENAMLKNFMHMEHPSLSRRHAIFLRNQKTNEAFLYDHGSTHGTSVNYKPIKGFEFHELQDGDIVRFGESTRMVVVHIEEPDDEIDEQ